MERDGFVHGEGGLWRLVEEAQGGPVAEEVRRAERRLREAQAAEFERIKKRALEKK